MANFPQGASLGYELPPLRGVLLATFDSTTVAITTYFFIVQLFFTNPYIICAVHSDGLSSPILPITSPYPASI